MTRTRTAKEKQESTDASKYIKKICEHAKRLHDAQNKECAIICMQLQNYISEKINFAKTAIPNGSTKTMKELKMHNPEALRSCLNQLSLKDITNASTHPKKKQPKKRSLSCAPDDDGYITGSSVASSSSNGPRASRSRTKQIASTRTTRSVSRSNVVKTAPLAKNPYQTPLFKDTSSSYGPVTPKVKPNTPQVVLRHPKQGEVAISLDGSPLLTQGSNADNKANLNIPLGDGRLIRLQPERGLRVSQLPEIDSETASQLRTLSEHLQKIFSHNRI